MNQEIKEKWVAALCSGDYKQGQGRLRDDDGFCCLGVLCNIIDPDSWRLEFNETLNKDQYKHRLGDEYGNYLSIDALADLELDFAHELDLACMNDYGSTFEDIAKNIEDSL